MYRYLVNWDKVIKDNLYNWLIKSKRLDWIRAWIKPLKVIHGDFIAVVNRYRYLARFNGQLIYLERLLNDFFDPALRRIYITDVNFQDILYIYRQSESKPFWVYRKWSSAVAYASGDFAIDGIEVYQCILGNTNEQPSATPTKWAFHEDLTFVRSQEDDDLVNTFIVHVPAGLTYSEIRMRAELDNYRLAGNRYSIVEF